MSPDFPDNRELLALARAWAALNYPGCPLESISLRLRYLPAAIRLVDGPSGANAIRQEDREGGPGLHPCAKDILDTLRAAGRPLSQSLLLEALGKRNSAGQCGEWSQSTVCRRLAELMADGTIENPEDARPRGYRIAE